MHDLSVRTLASSSRGNAHVLMASDGARLLLDAGLRWPDLQRALDHQATSLDGVLITHEHQDHARAVPQLLAASVDVYATPGTLGALGVRHHRAHAVAPLLPFSVANGWRALAVPVAHDAQQPVAFLISRAGQRVLYLTDAGWCAYRFDRLTHVLIEANHRRDLLDASVRSGAIPQSVRDRIADNHLSLERCVQLLQASDLSRVQQIVLLHLSDGNSDAEAFLDAVRSATGRPVTVAPA
jgi:phosphoribosyl 1,2-cyclic phosphodiesterase